MENIKRLNKIVVMMGMVLVLAVTLSGCSIGVKEATRTTKVNKKQVDGYTEYVDKSGVRFSYPSNWKDLSESSDQPLFGDLSTGSSVNYLSEDVPSSLKIDSYMSSAISNVKEQMDISGDVEENPVILNGKKATIIKYSVNQAGTTAIIKQAVFIEDGKAHVLTVAVLEDEEEDQTEVMDNIINSFTK